MCGAGVGLAWVSCLWGAILGIRKYIFVRLFWVVYVVGFVEGFPITSTSDLRDPRGFRNFFLSCCPQIGKFVGNLLRSTRRTRSLSRSVFVSL